MSLKIETFLKYFFKSYKIRFSCLKIEINFKNNLDITETILLDTVDGIQMPKSNKCQ